MYKLKELEYDYDALEPFIDTHTLGLHKNKHQRTYLNNLNKILEKNNFKFDYSLEELSRHIDDFPEGDHENLLFNLGGVINHNIYFSSMSPNKENPNELLMERINNKYGSYDEFKKVFKDSALSIKGSGYTFLVLKDSELEIVNLLNQDNPYNHNLVPLIGLDMWEHAFYINYENKKDIYIDNFFEVMDFKNANKLFNRV